jgi:hypothetical protein
MVIVAGIYFRFYIEVRVGTFLPTLTPSIIPSDYNSTALLNMTLVKKKAYSTLC